MDNGRRARAGLASSGSDRAIAFGKDQTGKTMSWISKLTPEGRLHNAVSEIEAALTTLGVQWATAEHEVKLAGGELMMDTMRRLIPDYDFSRNVYVQFFGFVRKSRLTFLSNMRNSLVNLLHQLEPRTNRCSLSWVSSVCFLASLRSTPLQSVMTRGKRPAPSTQTIAGQLTI
jgi:hypothetical protein